MSGAAFIKIQKISTLCLTVLISCIIIVAIKEKDRFQGGQRK